jgi:magnesium transporter
MPHPLFGPEIRLLLQDNDAAGIATFCDTLHPATVAETLTDEFSVEDVWKFLQHTSIPNEAAIFSYLPIEWQVKLAEGAGRQHMARLIEKMSHDDRVDLLRRLPPEVAEGLLRLVDEADRRDIATLTRYQENTAGALMTTDYAWLPANITAAEALERLRLQAPNTETIYVVYVLDDQRRLLGVVSLRELILAPRNAVVRDFMETKVVAVSVHDDPEKVAQELARYDLIAIPVRDDEGRLVGIVTHDDVIDVVVKEATEDVHAMGGITGVTENYLEANFTQIWRKRAVWLACLFVAELFTFTALAHFEDAIAAVVVLSLFVPLCISTGGNSGSQAATLITRALALGQVTSKQWRKVLRHELLMGLALGLTLGTIGFVRAALTPESVRSSSAPRVEAFTVTVPETRPLSYRFVEGKMEVTLPEGAEQVIKDENKVVFTLPEGAELKPDGKSKPGHLVYTFPEKCQVKRPAVSWWLLALVIAQAVAAICLWGTLVGSMLPLVFKRLGIDPGIASSPFVATFVDVTGIIIYFSIATMYLL